LSHIEDAEIAHRVLEEFFQSTPPKELQGFLEGIFEAVNKDIMV